MLLSTSLVGSVIGRGGRTIRQITTKTGAKICMKQDIITFSQFSLPGKGKKTFRSDLNNTSHATCTNDFGDQDDEEKDETTQPSYNRNSFMNVGEDNPKVDEQPLETCSVVNTIESISGNKSQSKLEVQSDKSQLAILFGSREQCSAALCEILTICFRESKHRGFSDPCLGLLVEQHIYAQLIMNKGKKYFNAIHAATGARISVTGTPLQIRSSNDNEEHNLAPTDRVLVVRGQLKSICAAEAFLSEHIRWATIESLIPSNFWPLLNHLPSLPLYDPQSVCSLIMSLGSIFWPQSVCAKLRKGTTLQYNNKQSLMRNVNMSRTDTIASKQVSTNIENNLDSVNSVDINHNHTDKHDQDVEDISNNSETINDVGNGERIMNSEESSDNNFNNRLSLNNELFLLADDDNEETLEEEVHHSKTADSVVSSDLEDKKYQSPPYCIVDSEKHKSEKMPDQSKPDQYLVNRLAHSTLSRETNHAVATAVQQSLIAAVGPIAWLATGGVLYMRVSYNEAGALIGSEGSRIQQLMQITGAEIYIGKVPISPPYAFNPITSRRSNSNNAPDDKSPVCISLADSFFDGASASQNFDLSNTKVNQSSTSSDNDCVRSSSGDGANINSANDINDTSKPTSDSITESPSVDIISEQTITDTSKCCYPMIKSSALQSNSCTVVHNSETSEMPTTEQKVPSTLTSTSSSNQQSYRLVSLSGSAQSQIMAQWQIFQRLKNLHKRQTTGSSSSDNANSNQKLFCLATLICLPYRFLWWLTTHNPGFTETSQSSSIPTSSVFPKFNDSDINISSKKSGTSPLNWIQSLASRRLKNVHLSKNGENNSNDSSVSKFIHVLPEPRRRRRLVQQHLKRLNATLRGHQQLNYASGGKSLILPPRGLTNDGLDQLWTHPNRIPLEIYADFETTQLILTNLHQMLALWLYGQSLAGTSVQSFIQAPIVYFLPNGRPANIPISDSANNRPYSKSSRHNTDQFDHWALLPGRQDTFLNPFRQPFHVPLLSGGIPNFGASTGGPTYSIPMLPDRPSCANLAQSFCYPRYPLINWQGMTNGKYSGQTITSDPNTTRPVRVGPPSPYGCWPRGRFGDTVIDHKHNSTESNQSSSSFHDRSPSIRFSSPGNTGYTLITNLHFPPLPPIRPPTHSPSTHSSQIFPGSCYRAGGLTQPKFRFRNPCGGNTPLVEPFIINSMPLLDTPNQTNPSNFVHNPKQPTTYHATINCEKNQGPRTKQQNLNESRNKEDLVVGCS
ncbi:KH domain-containing-like protein [Schistosoma japonicum]|nr:KH domain-containing-like protein [Schistosoma japonicum]